MDEVSPVVEFRRVEKRFGRVRALDRIDLAVAAGEFVALLGRDGAGTSTFVRLAAGLLRPDSGSVSVLGRHLRPADPRTVGRMGFAFEESDLDPRLSAEGHLRYRAGLLGFGPGQARRLARQTLERFGLDRGEDRAGVLSVPARRRLLLARASLGSPRVLMADRTADGLAPEETRPLVDPLRNMAATERVAVVLATAEPRVAAAAGRVVILDRGRIAFDGTDEAFRMAGAGNADAAFAVLVRAGAERVDA